MRENGLATVWLEASTIDGLQTLREFADFWKIPYKTDQAPTPHQVAISSGSIPATAEVSCPTVLCPSGDDNARKIAARFDLSVGVATSLIQLPLSRTVETSIRTKSYNFRGTGLKTIIDSSGIPLLSRLGSTNLYILSVDLTSTFNILLSKGLDDPPSVKFKIATRLPFSYRMIPSSVRNRVFRRDQEERVARESIGSIECLRTIFLASLLAASNAPIPTISFWKRGKKFGAAITHDVETEQGLIAGSKHLLRIEAELGVRSTWNVVSNRYPIDRDSLMSLARSGEIGAHDTNHDGRLILLPADSRTRRLRDCRETLEKLSGSKVRGFRAPLLQHDRELLAAVGKAGYTCDSSVPSWELLSPTSLRSHGVGTVFPISMEGIVEVPVSISQDHQLLRVRSLSRAEAGDIMIRESKWLREIGGMCTLLVHPDYDFATEAYASEYSRVLRSFSEDPTCQIMTLGDAADWWSNRQQTKLELSEDGTSADLVGSANTDELSIQVVTGFDKKGLAIKEFN